MVDFFGGGKMGFIVEGIGRGLESPCSYFPGWFGMEERFPGAVVLKS